MSKPRQINVGKKGDQLAYGRDKGVVLGNKEYKSSCSWILSSGWEIYALRRELIDINLIVVRLLERHNVFLRLTTPLSRAERAWEYSLF